jgi:uncharacterized protein (TIRG00374 family)
LIPKYKSLLTGIITGLFIIILAFGIGRFFTSPNFATFLSDLSEVLAQTDLLLFGLAIAVYLFSVVLASLSWNAILKIFANPVSVIHLIPVWMASIFVNNVTPMSKAGGEVIRVYGLSKKFGLSYTVAVLSVALNKLTEAAPVGLMAIIGAFVLVQHRVISWRQFAFISLIVCLIAGIITWIICQKLHRSNLWSKLLRYFRHKEQQISGNKFTSEKIIWSNKTAFIESLLFASAFWTMGLMRLKVLAYALDIELSFSVAAAATVWYIAVGLLAFTPGGIGIVESGLAAGLVLLGLPPSQAFALIVLDRAISYLFSTVIGAVCLFVLGGKQFCEAKRCEAQFWTKSLMSRLNIEELHRN